MATRAERAHADEQRKGLSAKKQKKRAAKKPAPEKKPSATANARAGDKLEKTVKKKRKSSRKSASRVKTDAPMNITAEVERSAPKSRATKSKAQKTRVRGKT